MGYGRGEFRKIPMQRIIIVKEESFTVLACDCHKIKLIVTVIGNKVSVHIKITRTISLQPCLSKLYESI